MSNIKPIADRVLIEADAIESVMESGLIIPEGAKEKPLKGTVIEVGDGKEGEAMTLKAGDRVLYGKHAGTEITVDGRDYIIMRQADIMATI